MKNRILFDRLATVQRPELATTARPQPSRRPLAAAVGLAALLLLAAGCGSGSKSPAVASLGTTGTTAGSASGSPSAQAGGSGPHRQGGSVVFSGVGVAAFAGCMRSHGVPDVPAPNLQGAALVAAGGGVDPNSPRFQSAEKACGSLMPGPTAAEQAHDQAQALKYSACMRSHGVPNFPDPIFSGGNIALVPRGIDQSSPLFLAAQKACESERPGVAP